MQATKPAKELNLSDEKDFNELGEFFKLNLKDKEFNEIYDKAAAAAQRLGVKVKFDESAGRSHFVLNDNTITIAAANKEHFQAQDLLHELIHATTRKALKDFNENPAKAAQSYTKRQIEAINEINSLYLKSKGIAKRQGKDAYALQNVDEFVAELSSSEFRAFLKAQDIFERFIKALIRFFTGDSERLAKNVNSYKALKESYYKILDDYEPPLAPQKIADEKALKSVDELNLSENLGKSQVSNKQQVREFYSQINALRKEQKEKIAQAKNEFDTADKEMIPERYKSNLINTIKNEVKQIDDEFNFDRKAYHTETNDLRVGKNGVAKMVKVKRVAFSFNDLAHARKSIDLMKENLTNDEFKEARQYFQRVIDKVEPLLKSVDDIESAKANLAQDLDTKISTIKKEFDDKITRLKESFANTPQEIKDERTRAIITNLKTNAKEFSYIDKDALAKAELEGYGEVISDERLARYLRRLSALREQIEQGTNTTPLKEFGTNYAEFYRDGQGAVKKLLAEKQGQVAGAFYRDDLAKATGTGEIDLVWGDSTKGLQHILERRAADFEKQGLTKEQATQKALEFVENDLNEIFQNGKATIQDNRAVIDTGDKMGIIALDYFGKDRKWIITAYNKYNASPSHSAGFAQNETLSHSNQLTSAKTGLDNVNSSENLAKSQADENKQNALSLFNGDEKALDEYIKELNKDKRYLAGSKFTMQTQDGKEIVFSVDNHKTLRLADEKDFEADAAYHSHMEKARNDHNNAHESLLLHNKEYLQKQQSIVILHKQLDKIFNSLIEKYPHDFEKFGFDDILKYKTSDKFVKEYQKIDKIYNKIKNEKNAMLAEFIAKNADENQVLSAYDKNILENAPKETIEAHLKSIEKDIDYLEKGLDFYKKNPEQDYNGEMIKFNEKLLTPKLQMQKAYKQRLDELNSLDLSYAPKRSADEIQITLPKEKQTRFTMRQNAYKSLKEVEKTPLTNANDGRVAYLNKTGRQESLSDYAINESAKNGFDEAQHLATAQHLPELFENAKFKETTKDLKNNDNNVKIHRYTANFLLDNEPAQAQITLKETIAGQHSGNKIYTLKLESVSRLSPAEPQNPREALRTINDPKSSDFGEPSAKPSEIVSKIQEKFKFGEKKAKVLFEWHKDSSPLTKNDDGTPKVFYHGSPNEFEVFDIEKTRGELGHYFTDDKSYAEQYMRDNGKIYAVFLKSKNIISLFDPKAAQKYKKFIFGDDLPELEKILKEKYKSLKASEYDLDNYKSAFYDLMRERNDKNVLRVPSIIGERLKTAGVDGVVSYKGAIVVFDSNQIKSIDNTGSWTDSAGKITKEKPSDESARHSYFNAQSPNILHSNEIWGGGLAGGTLNGLETDENGNIIGFDPAKFVAGFVAGAAGTKAVKLALQKTQTFAQRLNALSPKAASLSKMSYKTATCHATQDTHLKTRLVKILLKCLIVGFG